MKRNYLRHTASALIILLAMTACGLPSQAVQPTPGIDANAVGTSVAGTAQAAAQQTAVQQPSATNPVGTTIEQASDGTTIYTDYDGGFAITFPAGWLAVRPSSEEFDGALAKYGASNEMLHDQMTTDLDAYKANREQLHDYDRLYSYILRPDIKKNVIFGFSKLIWDSEDSVAIDNEAMGKVVRELEAPGGIPGFRADNAQIHEDSHVRMIEIGGRWTTTDGQGATIPFYSTIIFFKPSSNSTVRITFTFLQDYYAQISADVKSIVESIRIIE
jgi:hypothetical protein